MAALKQGYGRQMDFGKASGLVKACWRGEGMSSQDDAHASRWSCSGSMKRNAICRPQPTPTWLDPLSSSRLPASERPQPELLARAQACSPGACRGHHPIHAEAALDPDFVRWVENWLARPDLDARIQSDLRPRRALRADAGNNILAAIYYVAKPYDQARRQQERSEWKRLMPEPLSGKTLGIIGLGTIGTDLAHKASVLGMRVVVSSARPQRCHTSRPCTRWKRSIRLLARSDFVVLLLAGHARDRELHQCVLLRHMKKSAWLFNFAARALVVDADLVAAAEADHRRRRPRRVPARAAAVGSPVLARA